MTKAMNTIKNKLDLLNITETILTEAKQQGASSAEVGASVEAGFNVCCRKGDVETVEYNQDKGIGVTVYFNQNKGSASTSDISAKSIKDTVAKACNIAKFTAEDPCEGLADEALMAYDYPDCDLYHPANLTPEQAIEHIKHCDEIGMAEDKRIDNSEGAELSSHDHYYVYGNSHGFIGDYATSRQNISCVLIAKENDVMERDYSYDVSRNFDALADPKHIAHQAAMRTIRRLGARKLTTRQAPVIISADLARGFLGNFISAISGGNLYRESSFLLNHLDKNVFSDHITLTEYPLLKNGLGSAPFDSEGVRTQERTFVESGVLKSYVLSSYSGRRLKMPTTGNSGGVRNLKVSHSDLDFSALLKKMDTGLVVTEMMGQGVNIVTGDYSRGATGFWVENGEIQYPVHEITVAGNLKQLYQQIIAIGNDIDHRGNILTGSILLENMTIAGN